MHNGFGALVNGFVALVSGAWGRDHAVADTACFTAYTFWDAGDGCGLGAGLPRAILARGTSHLVSLVSGLNRYGLPVFGSNARYHPEPLTCSAFGRGCAGCCGRGTGILFSVEGAVGRAREE